MTAFRRIPSPLHLFLRALVIYFLAEGAVILLAPVILGGMYDVGALIVIDLVDDVLLLVLSAPFLWFLVIRPLRGTAVREQTRAATVVAHARDGIVTINDQGLVESFNPAAERIFGYGAEEVLGRLVTGLAPERYRDAHRRGLEMMRNVSPSRTIERTLLEVQGLRKDGREVPLELSLATWRVAEGTFHTAVVRDITERKQAEEAVRAHTSQLEAVRAVAAEITRELELSVVLNLLTRRAAELLGVKSATLLLWDEQIQQLCPRSWYGFGDRFKAIKLRLGEGFAGVVAQQRQGMIVHDYSASPHALSEISEMLGRSAVVGQPLRYRDRLLGVILLSNLGTERVFTEQDLETLGLFADQAAIAIENARLYEEVQSLAVLQERQRIAREMHDSFAQTLGVLHLQLLRARENCPPTDARLTAVLGEMAATTEHAYDELRQSIFDLRTMVSRGLGWIPTLTEYLHEFSARTGIPVRLEAADELPARLPPATEVQLIRIIQEALANVSKHAGADQARVRLRPEGRWVRMTIEDDGQGFQPEVLAATKRDHFGLEAMRERAESLGGKLEVDSAPGRGTRIVAMLPLEA